MSTSLVLESGLFAMRCWVRRMQVGRVDVAWDSDTENVCLVTRRVDAPMLVRETHCNVGMMTWSFNANDAFQRTGALKTAGG